MSRVVFFDIQRFDVFEKFAVQLVSLIPNEPAERRREAGEAAAL